MPEERHDCWKPYWSGEPTVLAFLKATNDAIEWMSDAGTTIKMGYGIIALVRDAEHFLNHRTPNHPEDGCELCCAERDLRHNIDKLKEIMRSS